MNHPEQSNNLEAQVQAQPQPQANTQKQSKKDKKASNTSKNPIEMTPPPAYLKERLDIWDRLKEAADAELASKPRDPITITLPDGKQQQGTSYETTPMELVKAIASSLADRTVISKVNGVLWDLERPFEQDSNVEFLDFNTEEGQQVFWHSSAHVLGEACERHYGSHLAVGPPTDDGFFYEMAIQDRMVYQEDYQPLEQIANSAIKEKQPFERLMVSKEKLLELFAYNKYKQYIISSKIPDGTSTTVYRCGPMIDLCRGPHIPHTGKIKAFNVNKHSASYFLGDAKNDSLQRVYGIAFPDKKQMVEYKHFIAEASKRDHRKIGKEQELFFFHELSPGSCFFLPNGTRIYNTLLDFLKKEYHARGYQEVITPNMFNTKVWETSGHWQNYAENMFSLDIEKEKFALKPMNCPGHCLLFDMRDRSYKELPFRVADFGVLHRNEASGALTGLTRVRRFQQDDAHIFCRKDQIENEFSDLFDFLEKVYGICGFDFKLKLSTRPEKYLGKVEDWDQAEKNLSNALEKFVPGKWELNPGDGAFYGPKIDITISDALRRNHQCATIQLDFQLPERFKLRYRTGNDEDFIQNDDGSIEKGFDRPVIIHRAILGSLERFIAIVTEHFGGKW